MGWIASTAIFYFVQGGLYNRSERRRPSLRCPPLYCQRNHRLFSRFLPKINSGFHDRIFGVVFYTAGRNQDDRFANEVYTRGVLKTRRAIDPPTVGYEPNTFNKEWIRRIIRGHVASIRDSPLKCLKRYAIPDNLSETESNTRPREGSTTTVNK